MIVSVKLIGLNINEINIIYTLYQLSLPFFL